MEPTNIVGLSVFAAIIIFFIAKSKIKRNAVLKKLAVDLGGEYINKFVNPMKLLFVLAPESPVYVRLTGKGGETRICFTSSMQTLTLEIPFSSGLKLLIEKKLSITEIISSIPAHLFKGFGPQIIRYIIKKKRYDKVQTHGSMLDGYNVLSDNVNQASEFVKDPKVSDVLRYFTNLGFTEMFFDDKGVHFKKSKYGLTDMVADKIKRHLGELEKLLA